MVEYVELRQKYIDKHENVGKGMTIMRQEHGYDGINQIGVNQDGGLVIARGDDKVEAGIATRLLNNPAVPDALSAPIKVYYDPTKVCGLKCPFCLAGVATTETRHTLPNLSEKQVSQVNRQIIDTGVLQVKVGGGEPFTYPQFWQIVKQLGEAGIALSTSTSGLTLANERMLPADNIALLAKYRVKTSISIDGKDGFHDKLRGRDGLLRDALRGRERLIREGVQPEKIEIRSTIANTPESMAQLDYLDQLSRALGIRTRIRMAVPTGSSVINDTSAIFPDDRYWEFFDKYRKTARINPLLNIDGIANYDEETAMQTALDCGAGTRSAFVDANGNFIPCGFISGFFPNKGHNLFTENSNMLKLWQSGEAFREVRTFLKNENETSACKTCKHVHSCQGGCPTVRLVAASIKGRQMEKDPRCPVDRNVYTQVFPKVE